MSEDCATSADEKEVGEGEVTCVLTSLVEYILLLLLLIFSFELFMTVDDDDGEEEVIGLFTAVVEKGGGGGGSIDATLEFELFTLLNSMVLVSRERLLFVFVLMVVNPPL